MTKVEIIDAAFRVWGRNFYLKTSLSQLANELGVSKPALYRHFKNKQALISAMNERFFDSFSAFIKEDFEQAQKNENIDEGIFILIRSIAVFFARNVFFFIFSLINIHDRSLGKSISEHISSRGADVKAVQLIINKKYDISPELIKLIFTTLTFMMSIFHKTNNSFEKTPSDEKIQDIVSQIYGIVKNGLKFSVEKIDAIDFEKLEKQVEANIQSAKPEPFFKAVAEAVAEAGPWDASMDMVAKRMGLSKSSLYGHFKNKKDMLRQVFMSEFMCIIELARNGIKLSENTAEQLYLGIYSISGYLKLRSEILVAIDWIRTRKLDLEKPDNLPNVFRLFEDVEIPSLHNAKDEEKQTVSQWILFLLISILIQPSWLEKEQRKVAAFKNGKNNDIRQLYQFITFGIEGFIR